jgi:hypothetical protein
MDNSSLIQSFNNCLPDEKLARLLPALSLLAEDIGEGIPLNRDSLAEILVSVGLNREEWAFEELGIWSKTLEKARDNSGHAQNDALIAELKSRGIPEFPSILSIYVAASNQKNRPVASKQKKTTPVYVAPRTASKRANHIDRPVESYHRLLPDHGWHNDITWEHLPNWIKTNPRLIARLKRGEQVIGRNVRYRFVANKLIRRLRYRIPVA